MTGLKDADSGVYGGNRLHAVARSSQDSVRPGSRRQTRGRSGIEIEKTWGLVVGRGTLSESLVLVNQRLP